MEFPSCFIQDILWILTPKLRSQLLRFAPQLGRALVATALLNKVQAWNLRCYRYVLSICYGYFMDILSIFLGEFQILWWNYIMIWYAEFRWIQEVLVSLATQKIPHPNCCRITWPSQVTQDICRLKRAFPTKPQFCKKLWARQPQLRRLEAEKIENGGDSEAWKSITKSYESMKLDTSKIIYELIWNDKSIIWHHSWWAAAAPIQTSAWGIHICCYLLQPVNFKKWPQKMCN